MTLSFRNIITACTLMTACTHSYAQKACDITEHYADFIQVTKLTTGGESFVFGNAVPTSTKSCFGYLINENQQFLNYLLTHFTPHENREATLAEDGTVRNKLYFAALNKDKQFNSLISRWSKICLDRSLPPDTVSMDDLLNIAVKFFSVSRLTPEAYYVGKVCTGKNVIKDTEPVRKPFVEAFCFSSIQNNYEGGKYALKEEFTRKLQELYTMNLGLDPGERLLRAQGAMFALMRNSAPLRDMLAAEYASKHWGLPFILVDK